LVAVVVQVVVACAFALAFAFAFAFSFSCGGADTGPQLVVGTGPFGGVLLAHPAIVAPRRIHA
jgi:hypothetical protein